MSCANENTSHAVLFFNNSSHCSRSKPTVKLVDLFVIFLYIYNVTKTSTR